MIRDVAKYYKNKKHATVYIGKNIADKLNLENREVLVVEYDEGKKEIKLKALKDFN